MKTQHTQGPWSISAYGTKDNPTYRIEADFSDTGSGERPMTQILAEINSGVKDALLIAAAPNLLESCEKILEILAEFEAKKDQAKIVTALRFAIDYAGIEKSIKKAKDEL